MLLKTLRYLCIIFLLSIVAAAHADIPSKITGIYLPPNNFTKRRLIEFKYYSDYTKMNAVVIHMKDPHGLLYWNSTNPTAKEIGAVVGNNSLMNELNYLKSHGIWTIAKVDIFIDSKLAQNKQDYGLKNSKTGDLWVNFGGLNWTNPYDSCVWEYNIDLCRELVREGFDEIQFDYVRFPSDGNLNQLKYPLKQEGINRSKCISRFLAKAYAELKPLGAYVSVDVFGLTAWKKSDFGIGQVIEDISPHVDIICPMFYPSHFPNGFLGLEKPSDHPGKIMYLSIMMMKKRTDKIIRPWIQGFWYSPEEISLQLKAVQNAGLSDWMVWHSSGYYKKTNNALIADLSNVLPQPEFYPSVEELKKRTDKTIKGNTIIINYTNYLKGYSILSLEEPSNNKTGKYSTPTLVVHSLDEAILDLILIKNRIPLNRQSGKYMKSIRVAGILCRQIKKNPRKIKPQPIYVNWGGSGSFSLKIPSK